MRKAAVIYDVTDPEKPKKVNECKQSGGYADSRLINGKLYIVSSYGVNTENIKRRYFNLCAVCRLRRKDRKNSGGLHLYV